MSYSSYTTLVSKWISTSSDSLASATIVRFNPGDPDTDKHGVYEYLVDRKNGFPFEFEISDADFPPGTLVRHIAMELGKYNKIMTAPTNSLWYLAHHYLFDSVLPYRIVEQRNNQSKDEDRFVGGNHRRLSQGRDTEYQREAIRTFHSGSVAITWWVLSAEGDNPRSRIYNYCLPSKPIVITYNGQKQGELPYTVIKDDLKLPYLERYLIVHIDCDRLDSESRRQLFPTTRESLRDTRILEHLRQLVVETLEADDELRRLDRQRKQRYLERAESASAENLRRRLAARISQLTKSGGAGSSPRVKPPSGEPDGEHPRVPIPVEDPPTFIEITGRDPRQVYAGRPFVLRFKTDADPSYFRDPDAFLAIIDPPSFGQYTGTTTVRDGHGSAYFRVDSEAAVGSISQITLELRPRRAKTLEDSIGLEVISMPQEVGPDRGDAPRPNINPRWVTSNDPFWKDHRWDEHSVAKVISEEDSVDIYVSAENRRVGQLVQRAQRRGMASVDSIRDFYLEHIAFHAFLRYVAQDRKAPPLPGNPESDEDIDQEMSEHVELKRVCETLCGIIDQTFDLLATRTAVGSEETLS